VGSWRVSRVFLKSARALREEWEVGDGRRDESEEERGGEELGGA
jgi:hypothetical protein